MIDLRKDFAGKVFVSNEISNKSLYKHQEDCINALKNIENEDKYKSLLVIPTGGGKTFTSVYWVLNEIINKNKKVLWIAHRHELLNQTLTTVINSSYKDILNYREEFTYRIISGAHDKTVNINKDDDFIIASKDSLNSGSEYIEKWLEENRDNVCLIIDEAHHAIAKSYRKIIDMIEEKSLNWYRIIGLTATPIRTREKEKGLLGNIFTDGICYSIDLKTLINRGILAKPIFKEYDTNMMITKELSANDLHMINRGFNLPQGIAEEIAKHKERNNFIVNEYIKNKSKYGKTIVFAINIGHAIALNSLFNEKGIKSDFVVSSLRDGATNATISTEENVKKINSFRDGDLDVLINVNILTEGTDIPNIQTVFLTRPTTSSILMNQMIGRGLRGANAGGTEEAYIVSFIDEWRYKINWINPKQLEGFGDFISTSGDSRSLKSTLVPIKLIEEFTKFMDKSLKKKIKDYDSMELVPLGSYSFNIFDENINEDEEVIERECEVLVFNNLRNAYEDLVNNLSYIFERCNIKNENLSDDEITNLINLIYSEYFDGYDLTIGFNKSDIEDIIRYYALTGEAPDYIPFEGRENYDISKLANDIINSNFTVVEKANYIKSKWEDKNLGWSIYFNNDFYFFRNEINRVVDKILYGDSKPIKVEVTTKYEDMSLSQIRNIDIGYWRELTDKLYEECKDSDGYYNSNISLYKSKNRRFFNIDHIIPMKDGGKTILSNLQVIARWENMKKGIKPERDIRYEEINYYIENNIESNNFIKERLKELYDNDESDIDYLNFKSIIAFREEKYRSALIFANKALKINPYNIIATKNKGLASYYKGNKKVGIELLDVYVHKIKNDFKIQCLIGEYHYKQNRINKALYYFSNAENIDNKNYACNFKLARIYDRKKKLDEAIKYYDKCIEISGSNDDVDSCFNYKGCIYFDKGLYNEALECFKNAYISYQDDVYLENFKITLKNIHKNYRSVYKDIVKELEEIIKGKYNSTVSENLSDEDIYNYNFDDADIDFNNLIYQDDDLDHSVREYNKLKK